MRATDTVQRVSIYLNERDSHNGQPLYLMVLDRLRREGATGATALRGIAGFGAGNRMRSAGMVDLSQTQPVVIEWIDRAERVLRVLPALDELLSNALITVESIDIYRAVLRSSGPFGTQSIGESVAREVATAHQTMRLADALRRMIDSQQALLPIVDNNGRLVGAIEATFGERYGLPPLRLLAALAPDERDPLLATLPDRPLAEAVGGEPRTAYVEASVPQTVSTMIEWGLEALPVVDREGRFVGLFGVEQALQAALASATPQESGVRDADPPPEVHLVMQMVVPNVAATTPLATALTQLLGTAARFLIVTDAGAPIGTLTDTALIAHFDGAAREAWVSALRSGATALPSEVAATVTGATAATFAGAPPGSIGLRATQNEAIKRVLNEKLPWIAAVDDSGRLAGLVTRRGLMRALAQESVG